MSAERPRSKYVSSTEIIRQASSCLRGCGTALGVRILLLLALSGVQLGMALLVQYMGAPLTLGSLFVLLVVLFEFWPREPYPPRSRWRWLYCGPLAGLLVSICYSIYLEAAGSEDGGWAAAVALGMLALLGLVSKVDKWVRGEKGGD